MAGKKITHRKNGRRTTYKKEYCEQVIKYVMEGWQQGHTFRSWVTSQDIAHETAENWCQKQADFRRAREICREKEHDYWIGLLRKASEGNTTEIQESTTEIDLRGAKPKPIKQIVHKKKSKMSVAAITFALVNLFPEKYRREQKQVDTGESPFNILNVVDDK